MKKIFLSAILLIGSTISLKATTLNIMNECANSVCIYTIQLTKVNGISYEWYDTNCVLTLKPMTNMIFTDNDVNNQQFAFLNVYPFIGNVWEEYGNGTPSSVANLPLPQTNDLSFPSNSRHSFEHMKFKLDNDIGKGAGPDWDPFTSTIAQDDFYKEFDYYYLNGEQYFVSYFYIFGMRILRFADL